MQPRSRVLVSLWAVSSAALACCLAPVWLGVQASEAPVTYSGQIAPILYKNCSGCHHEGGSGPFSLTSYAEARRWGGLMETVTQSRYMPPWLPEPGHGIFAGDRRLPAEEIALIKRWVASGMPEGIASEAPKPPTYTGEWQLGAPDLVLEVSSDMQVPASGPDLFRNFILPNPLKETKWVRAMEIKPGSPQVVHHANLILDPTASLRRLHPRDWTLGIPGMDVVVDAGEQFDPDGHFLDWKPDSSALVEPPGMPWRLDPGSDLVLNMHLKPTGKPETIRARIGLYFADKPATQEPILLQLEHDAALDIRAGDPDFVVEDQLTLPVPVSILAIYPHAHYLGKRLEGWAVLPDGSRQDLILIRNWDINRQSIYRYARPVELPAGAVVHMRYVYDNSAANPHNPNSPPIRVTAGNRSVDEMGHLWLQVLPRAGAVGAEDPREPLLRAWMENALRKDPADATALFNLGSIDMSRGDFPEAVSLYQRAVGVRPGDSRLTTALGAALERNGDWQSARGEFTAAVGEDSSYVDARFDLAALELKHEEYSEAEQQFRALIAIDAKDATAHAGLGSVLLASGRMTEARKELQEAVDLDSSNADALYSLAKLDAAEGLVGGALGHLKNAVALRPKDVDLRTALAALYGASGAYAEALGEQRTVVSLAATRPDAWNDLGVLEARVGDSMAAHDAFEHALALDPGNKIARANLSRLHASVR